MALPASPWPWVMMSTKALRSMVMATARRISRLSNGGTGFISRFAATFIGDISHWAVGICAFTSSISGTVSSNGNVMSNLPEAKDRIAVERLAMMVCSMPSR